MLKVKKINEAKKVAAYEITKLVHGEENAKKAQEAAKALFEGKGNTENMPTVEVEEDSSILDAIITAGFASSKGQAKTLIAQGGITLNDEKVSDIGLKLSKDLLEKEVILRKGKKSYCKLQMK